MEGKGKWAAPVAACVVLIALMVAAYVAGYFYLAIVHDVTTVNGRLFITRCYKYEWQAVVYRPMAEIESLTTGGGYVYLVSEDSPVLYR